MHEDRSAPISVTVAGPSFARAVTWEQVRAYLRAKGWVLRVRSDNENHIRVGSTEPEGFAPLVELWICPGWAEPLDPSVHLGVFRGGEASVSMAQAVYNVARHERRGAADVLREIAGDAEACAPDLETMLARAKHELERERRGEWMGAYEAYYAHDVPVLVTEIERLDSALAAKELEAARAAAQASAWKALAKARRALAQRSPNSEAEAVAICSLRALGLDPDAP